MGETWTGNLTLKMDDKEDTYAPGTFDVVRYSDVGIELKLSSNDERAKVVMRLSPNECKALIKKLTNSLEMYLGGVTSPETHPEWPEFLKRLGYTAEDYAIHDDNSKRGLRDSFRKQIRERRKEN